MELPKKADLVDTSGRPLTQSLFLELGYSDYAVFTLKEDHYEYEGKLFPSLKKLYLEAEDPTEYDFASLYLLGWRHWKRLCENKAIRSHVDEWREELEVRLRTKAVKNIMLAADQGSYQAAKWLADRGWDQRAPGRPSKEEIERSKRIDEKISDEYSADVHRLYVGEKVG